MRFNLIIILSLFAFSGATSAQDSTFSARESFRINQIEEGVVTIIKSVDLDSDGVNELVGAAHTVTNGITHHKLVIYRSSELSYIGEECREYVRNIFLYDFNSDGQDDIIFVTYPSQYFEVYLAPDYNLVLNEPQYYPDRPIWGGNRLLENGDTVPYVISSGSFSQEYSAEDTSYFEFYSCGVIYQGTWENGRPERLTTVVKPANIINVDDGENNIGLLLGGYSVRGMMGYGPINGGFESEDTYYQLFTNYRRAFSEFDSLVIFESPSEDELGNRAADYFGFGYDSELGDFNNDGEVEWYVPMWAWDGEENYQCSILSVDPVTLDTTTVFSRRMDDFTAQGASPPIPVRGIVAIDPDEGGDFLFLLAIQNHPLFLLDCETMEVVAESDFNLPDNYSSCFDVGCFDESGKLQMLIQDENSFVIYNLFEEPGNVSELEILPFCLYLDSPHPNPFNSTTTIGYSLPTPGAVLLVVYGLSGREVARLADGVKPAGAHEAVWVADGMASGLYVVALEAGGVMLREKVVLVK